MKIFEMVQNIDNCIGNGIKNLHNDKLTKILKVVTELGDKKFIVLFLLVVFVVLIYLIFVKYRNFSKRKEIAQLFDKVFISFVLVFPLGLILKKIIGRERPKYFNHLVEETGYSMPSGHSLSATWLFLVICLLSSKIKNGLIRALVILLMLVLSVTIVFSRLYFGVHYFSDTMAGILLATGMTLLAFKLSDFRRSFFMKNDDNEENEINEEQEN